MTKILCITLKKVRAASLTRQSEQLSEDPPSPFQDSAVSLAAQRGLETESTHSPSPTPADMKEVTELPAAPQPAGVQPVKRKTSMDSGNTPIEQVLRAAAANPRFSDCPPEHTDKIAESPAQNRSFMQRMRLIVINPSTRLRLMTIEHVRVQRDLRCEVLISCDVTVSTTLINLETF
ncbi:uncharacterized protein LOC120841158 [Ixodes scapularis]|uniref:uncharacterized protein LOC120841158 n=1 Tax=Ixodes scapularis TaxID=6945 RepID=UPI001C38BA6E|nr:uncharacterized protein LOC120841158 [Ixodes scapularis]